MAAPGEAPAPPVEACGDAVPAPALASALAPAVAVPRPAAAAPSPEAFEPLEPQAVRTPSSTPAVATVIVRPTNFTALSLVPRCPWTAKEP